MRPTHRHKPTGSLVFPEGYAAKDLVVLPGDFWDQEDERVKMAEIRVKRDQLLSESDHVMLPDRGFSEEVLAEWVLYRKQLRDITLDTKNLVWPKKPKG